MTSGGASTPSGLAGGSGGTAGAVDVGATVAGSGAILPTVVGAADASAGSDGDGKAVEAAGGA